jgi:hypothetical protein
MDAKEARDYLERAGREGLRLAFNELAKQGFTIKSEDDLEKIKRAYSKGTRKVRDDMFQGPFAR